MEAHFGFQRRQTEIRLYELRFRKIGRKEFHTLVKSSVLESARPGFKSKWY